MSLLKTDYYSPIFEDGALDREKTVTHYEQAAYTRVAGGNVIANYSLSCKQGNVLLLKGENSCQLFYKNDGIEITDLQIAEELLRIMNLMVIAMQDRLSSTPYNFQWAGLHPDLEHSIRLMQGM